MITHSFRAAVVVLFLASCLRAPSSQLTVAQHRNEAALHEQRADEALSRYQPDTVRPPPRGLLTAGQSDGVFDGYNPTEGYVAQADAELRKANEHLAAARTLVAFEARACQGLSVAQRTACPLFASTVEHVTPGPNGFVLRFKPGVDVTQTYRQLSCHLAYAVSTGFDRPSCPLFVKGMMIAREGARSVSFLGESDAVTEQLQAAARSVFAGNAALSRRDAP
jgi:hypothetical protein